MLIHTRWNGWLDGISVVYSLRQVEGWLMDGTQLRLMEPSARDRQRRQTRYRNIMKEPKTSPLHKNHVMKS